MMRIKCLVIGIILLLVGTVIVQSSGQKINEKRINPGFTGRTIYVDDNNTEGPWDGTAEHPFRFINDGVKNASDGEIIYVRAGTYSEHVVVEKSLYITGEGSNKTIMHPIDQTTSCFTIIVDSLWITNFSFIGNYSFYPALLIFSSYQITVSLNTFNSFYFGIRMVSSNEFLIANNHILNCHEGGISLFSCSMGKIRENYINGYFPSAAIDLEGCYSNIIEKNIIHGIKWSQGIWLIDSTGNKVIYNNLIQHDVGVFIQGLSRDNHIENNNFYNTTLGGGFYEWSFSNYWNGNYWNRPRHFPQPIFGNILNLWVIKFDWSPAQEPYNIP